MLIYIKVQKLSKIKQRALRRNKWYNSLNRIERGIIDLSIRCLTVIKSATLAKMVLKILRKLEEALKSKLEKLMDTVSREKAFNISILAQAWGYKAAHQWAHSKEFIRYLASMELHKTATQLYG